MDEKIGERFQRETQYDRRRMPAGSLDLDGKPSCLQGLSPCPEGRVAGVRNMRRHESA